MNFEYLFIFSTIDKNHYLLILGIIYELNKRKPSKSFNQ